MDLNCRFFATFRQAVGSKTIEREVENGTTVHDLLSALEAEYDGLEGQLLDGNGLKPSINVLRNGREVLHMDGPGTELADGDTVSVFPPVAGGTR